MGRLYMREVSLRVDRYLVNTRVTPNQLTYLMTVCGVLAAPALLVPGITGAVLGVVAVQVGLLVSWYAATAAGSSIAMTAIGLAVASWALRSATRAAGTALRTPEPTPTTAPAPPVLVPR